MSTEQNKATVLRCFNALGPAFEETINQFVSEDCEVANIVSSVRGRQAFFQSREVLEAAFSELRVTVQNIVADGDQVVVRSLWSGIHHGAFLGVEPTGKPVQWVTVVFLGLQKGQIVSWWSLVDRYAIVEQLTGPKVP